MAKEKRQNLGELAREYKGYVLTRFIEEGGAGLQNAIFNSMSAAITWYQEEEKLRGKTKG